MNGRAKATPGMSQESQEQSPKAILSEALR